MSFLLVALLVARLVARHVRRSVVRAVAQSIAGVVPRWFLSYTSLNTPPAVVLSLAGSWVHWDVECWTLCTTPLRRLACQCLWHPSPASGDAAHAAVRSHARPCCAAPRIAVDASRLACHCDLHELGPLWFRLFCTPLRLQWHLHAFQPLLQHHQHHHHRQKQPNHRCNAPRALLALAVQLLVAMAAVVLAPAVHASCGCAQSPR